jgi:hypothetical protein
MKVELSQQDWQAVLALLARAPYQEVAQLIQSIAQQLQPAPAAEQPRPHFKEVTNG